MYTKFKYFRINAPSMEVKMTIPDISMLTTWQIMLPVLWTLTSSYLYWVGTNEAELDARFKQRWWAKFVFPFTAFSIIYTSFFPVGVMFAAITPHHGMDPEDYAKVLAVSQQAVTMFQIGGLGLLIALASFAIARPITNGMDWIRDRVLRAHGWSNNQIKKFRSRQRERRVAREVAHAKSDDVIIASARKYADELRGALPKKGHEAEAGMIDTIQYQLIPAIQRRRNRADEDIAAVEQDLARYAEPFRNKRQKKHYKGALVAKKKLQKIYRDTETDLMECVDLLDLIEGDLRLALHTPSNDREVLKEAFAHLLHHIKESKKEQEVVETEIEGSLRRAAEDEVEGWGNLTSRLRREKPTEETDGTKKRAKDTLKQ